MSLSITAIDQFDQPISGSVLIWMGISTMSLMKVPILVGIHLVEQVINISSATGFQ